LSSTTQPSAGAQPAIEGWFTTEGEPCLLGKRCPKCGTFAFPPTAQWCPNPACMNDTVDTVRLSRRATIWSYTDARYQPPPPYITTTDPYVPFSIVAAELAEEKLIVLGQVANGFGLDDLEVGGTVELVVEPMYEVDGVERLTWRWRPVASNGAGATAGKDAS
jgi:uncharacterized OB-fold protein